MEAETNRIIFLAIITLSSLAGGVSLVTALVTYALVTVRMKRWDQSWWQGIEKRSGRPRGVSMTKMAEGGIKIAAWVGKLLGVALIIVLLGLALMFLDILASSPSGPNLYVPPAVRSAAWVLAIAGGLLVLPAYLAAHLMRRLCRIMRERLRNLAADLPA